MHKALYKAPHFTLLFIFTSSRYRNYHILVSAISFYFYGANVNVYSNSIIK